MKEIYGFTPKVGKLPENDNDGMTPHALPHEAPRPMEKMIKKDILDPSESNVADNNNDLPTKQMIRIKSREVLQRINVQRAHDATQLFKEEDLKHVRENVLRFPTMPDGFLLWKLVHSDTEIVRQLPRYYQALLSELHDRGLLSDL